MAVSVESRDELGLLAVHFNRMLSRISQFNEELTLRVEAATRELAQRNEELRLANESLFQAQRQLVQSEKLSALGHVAATMAHEVGTPLNSISGLHPAYASRRDGLRFNDQALEDHRVPTRSSYPDHSQLAPFYPAAGASAPGPGHQPAPGDIMILTQPGMSMRGITLVRQLDASAPPDIRGPRASPAGLPQPGNQRPGCDAPGGGPHHFHRLPGRLRPGRPLGRGGGQDTGPACPRSEAEGPGTLLHHQRAGKGAGLGLSICEEIIRSHHGRMEIESEEGKGSTIRVQLPVISRRRSSDHAAPGPYTRRG